MQRKFWMIQLKLNLIKNEIDELKEKIKENKDVCDSKLFGVMIRSIDFRMERLKKEIRKIQMFKASIINHV